MKLATIGLVLISTACAPVMKLPEVNSQLAEKEARIQREMAVSQQYKDMTKINEIAYSILLHGTDLCPENLRKGTGITIANRNYFGKDFSDASETILGLTDNVTIIQVVPGSAGDHAGLMNGDIIRALNEWDVPEGDDAISDVIDKYKEISEHNDEINIEWTRNNNRHESVIKFDEVCDYGYQLQNDDSVNAFANGTDIFITSGMMRFIETDEELALIIGHEFAHNQMEHVQKSQGNAALGMIVDILFAGIGVNTSGAFSDAAYRAYSQEFEAEADYVGMYFAAHAGYDISHAPHFWRRMAVAHPGNIKTNHASSHPASPERFVGLEATLEEIESKIAAGRPLMPEIDN